MGCVTRAFCSRLRIWKAARTPFAPAHGFRPGRRGGCARWNRRSATGRVRRPFPVVLSLGPRGQTGEPRADLGALRLHLAEEDLTVRGDARAAIDDPAIFRHGIFFVEGTQRTHAVRRVPAERTRGIRVESVVA